MADYAKTALSNNLEKELRNMADNQPFQVHAYRGGALFKAWRCRLPIGCDATYLTLGIPGYGGR